MWPRTHSRYSGVVTNVFIQMCLPKLNGRVMQCPAESWKLEDKQTLPHTAAVGSSRVNSGEVPVWWDAPGGYWGNTSGSEHQYLWVRWQIGLTTWCVLSQKPGKKSYLIASYGTAALRTLFSPETKDGNVSVHSWMKLWKWTEPSSPQEAGSARTPNWGARPLVVRMQSK